MASREFLVGWPLRNHARSHPSILCPEHIPTNTAEKLEISFWKNEFTRLWPQRDQLPLWQRDFWDRQLRRGDSYSAKWKYVINNPVRHGLVERAEDWPYQGELNRLAWHDP